MRARDWPIAKWTPSPRTGCGDNLRIKSIAPKRSMHKSSTSGPKSNAKIGRKLVPNRAPSLDADENEGLCYRCAMTWKPITRIPS